MENIFVEFLPPWVETGLQPAFYDKESGTVLQQTARMYARVNMLIRMFNKLSKNTKTTVEDYINQFNELHDYVHDYFDNLDVQEEINNKLDAMVEAGTLQEIIASYLSANALWCYDTIEDMQSATNLVSGSFAKTLGKTEINDGYGAYYKIGSVGEITLNNGLKAKLVDKPGDNNFVDINFTVARYNDTTCYITTIPYKDSHNREIEIVPEIADEGVSPIQHARNINSSLTFNASAYSWHGSVIGDSSILNNADTSNLPTPFCYVGIKGDRTLVTYSRGTSANNMILDGCKQSWLAYWKLITNSTKEDFDQIEEDFAPGRIELVNYPNPRQALGITSDKTIYLVSCDGRTSLDKGLTSEQLADIMLSLGCVEAWNLDGGGSTSTIIKGYKINKNIDSNGTVDRATTRIYASVKYDTTNDAVAKANSYAGKAIFENNNKLLPIIGQSIIKWEDNADLDTNATPQSVKLMGHIQNPITEIDNSMYVINLPHPLEKWYGKYACQLTFNREYNRAFSRRLVNDAYTRWEPLCGAKGMLFERLATFTSTADSTYEPVSFGEKVENSPSFITFDDESPTVFKIDSQNVNQLFKISYTVFVRTSTPGNKYVRIGRGSTYVDNLSISYSTVSDRAEISGELILSTIRPTDELRLEVYGATGDIWERPRVIIETI